MTEEEAGSWTADCHEMLLRLAGRLPDDLISRSRGQLAQGELGELARAVVFNALSHSVPLHSADVAILTELLAGTAGDRSALAEVEIDDPEPMTWSFTSEPPEADDAGTGQGETEDASTSTGMLDRAIAEALAQETDATGCWRAWRIAPGDAPTPPIKPVFVVEVAPDADMAGVTARLQQQLADAGEPSPQVEVFSGHLEPPIYQSLARDHGELIWDAAEDPGIRIASTWDQADPARYAPDRAVPHREHSAAVDPLGRIRVPRQPGAATARPVEAHSGLPAA